MGMITVEAEVSAGDGERRPVQFLVDSGAAYSVLPERVWRALGLRPKRRLDFALADGTIIERDVSECRFHFQGVDGHSPVVLGGPNDAALLGTVTLEALGLVLNPLERTIRPARLRLGALAAPA